jgi:hypothetical protein
MPDLDASQGRMIYEKAGYTRRRLPSGVTVLTLADANAETLDAWFEDCNKLMSRWQPDDKLRYLHDIRGAEFVTPHATDLVAKILRRMRYTPIGDGRGAVVLRNSTISSLLSMFLNRRMSMNWEIRFFSDDSEALRWLES